LAVCTEGRGAPKASGVDGPAEISPLIEFDLLNAVFRVGLIGGIILFMLFCLNFLSIAFWPLLVTLLCFLIGRPVGRGGTLPRLGFMPMLFYFPEGNSAPGDAF